MENRLEFLGIGDLHLTSDSGSGALSKYIQDPDDMVVSECEKVLEYGKKRGVRNIVLYGDIFDSPRGSYSGMTALSRFFSNNDDFKFYVILGNHDLYGESPRTGHSLEVLKLLYSKNNVQFFLQPKTIDMDGAKVCFLPYPHEEFNLNAINIFHKEVYGSKNDAGRMNKEEKLSNSKAVVVAGHLHTAHRIRNTYYSGTLYQTNFGESLPKYFHHVEFNTIQDYNIELVKHDPKYKLSTIVLQNRDDLSSIPTGATNLVKLVILDGADISPSDYSSKLNIVMIKPFKSKKDLAILLTEDLTEGKPIQFRTEEFFKDWLKSLDCAESMRERIREQRRSILNRIGV